MVKVRFSDYMFELLSMDFCDQEFKKNVRIISNNGFIINIGNLPCGLGLLSSSLGGQALLLNLLDMDREIGGQLVSPLANLAVKNYGCLISL